SMRRRSRCRHRSISCCVAWDPANVILPPRSNRWNCGAGPGPQLQVDEDAAVLEDLVPHAVQLLLQQQVAPIQLPDPVADPFAALAPFLLFVQRKEDTGGVHGGVSHQMVRTI